MNQHFSDTRKIDPSRRPDGSRLTDDDRAEIGPTPLAYAEWEGGGHYASGSGKDASVTAIRASSRRSMIVAMAGRCSLTR